jgi:ABC-2 type transport system ATP-binding protein
MIEIKDLYYQYGNSRRVLNGLDLNLEQGKIYGLLGRNGAGKSTLLKCMSGLLIPGLGKIKIGDWDAKDRLPSFLADLFFLTEEIPSPDIRPDEYGRVYGVFYPKYDQSKFNDICVEFEIPMTYRLDEMSYGQKKKALIAFGIACNTKLIILDEPTNGLDIPSKSQFRKIVSKYTSDQNCILISTHQIKDIENLIDHVIIMNEGALLFNQPLEQVSKTLYFSETPSLNHVETPLYSEESIHGYAVVDRNLTQEDSKIDLELLYKAIMNNTKMIHQLFN